MITHQKVGSFLNDLYVENKTNNVRQVDRKKTEVKSKMAPDFFSSLTD